MNRGEPPRVRAIAPRPTRFNSATAVNRGEPAVAEWCTTCAGESLQFGHGGEPWRTSYLGSVGEGVARFNSATAVNRGEPPNAVVGRRMWPALQFGHGGEPWRTRRGRTRRRYRPARFNSATAVNRGEPAGVARRTKCSRSLQFGHGGEPWRTRAERGEAGEGQRPASIRPRR